MPTTSETFAHTGAEQTWQVPVGVSTVTVEAWGAQGGSNGGRGGYIKADLSVTGGETLYIRPGGADGWNGGGNGGAGAAGGGDGGPGGGASDVRQGGNAAADRVVVAGGGGGDGGNVSNAGKGGGGHAAQGGGDGGGYSDGEGGEGGGAGTADSGGAGGSYSSAAGNGSDGTVSAGGDGGDASTSGAAAGGGGGAGGGWYGGGGGQGAFGAVSDSNQAGGGGGGGGYSGVDSAVTSAVARTNNSNTGDGQVTLTWTAPAPYDATVTSVGATELTLEWQHDGDVTPDHFNVYRSTSSGVTTSDTLAGSTVDGTTTTFTDSGLSEETTYYYVVTAVYNGGSDESDASNETSGVTRHSGPQDLTVTGHDGTSIDLSWTPPQLASNEEVVRYHIYRDTEPGDALTSDYTEVDTVTAGQTTYTDSGLSEGTTYHYRVTATLEEDQ